MIIVNLYGGPGVGKTTLMYYLVARLKQAGIRAEAVGEAARELIYDHAPGTVPPQLVDNQFSVSAQQYERLKRLERHGIGVAVSDSPIRQGLVYAPAFERATLKDFVNHLESRYDTIDVFVKRVPGDYDPESRVQKTEEEAAAIDERVKPSVSDWVFVRGQEERLVRLITDKVRAK